MHTVNDLPAYTYTALNCGEIRLLKPADTCSGHAWNMEIVSLDAAELEFDALSYTWGSQNETYPIVCMLCASIKQTKKRRISKFS
jgi:hypothetical protein